MDTDMNERELERWEEENHDANYDPEREAHATFMAETLGEMEIPLLSHVPIFEDGPGDDFDLNKQAAEVLVKRLFWNERRMADDVKFIDAEIVSALEVVEALRARRDQIVAPYNRRAAFLRSFFPALSAFAREALKYGTARSLKLAFGTVGFQKSRSLKVEDEGAALAWAFSFAPECVKETISVSAAKKYALSTGRVPDGCRLEVKDGFYVDAALPEGTGA